jgi:MSHA biogenesis protein MshG
MSRFCYQGRDANGTSIQGELDAADKNDVASQLQGRNIVPIEIMESKPARISVADWLLSMTHQQRIAAAELSFFCRQMYTLLNAGVPVFDALTAVRESASNPVLARVVDAIRDGLNEGNELSTTLRRQPGVFSPMFVAVVEVG